MQGQGNLYIKHVSLFKGPVWIGPGAIDSSAVFLAKGASLGATDSGVETDRLWVLVLVVAAVVAVAVNYVLEKVTALGLHCLDGVKSTDV